MQFTSSVIQLIDSGSAHEVKGAVEQDEGEVRSSFS